MLLRDKNNKSIKHINLMALVFALLFAFVATGVIILNEYLSFKAENEALRERYKEEQKKSALKNLHFLSDIVRYRFEQSKEEEESVIEKKIGEDIRALMRQESEHHYVFIQKKNQAFVYVTPAYANATFLDDSVESMVFEPLQWRLGSGVQMQGVEEVLAHNQKAYEDKIIDFVLKIYMLTLFLYLVSTIEYRYVSELIGREIRFISVSFKKASQNYEFIDTEKIKFQEFQEIVSQANAMIEQIKSKNSALLGLNSSLEEIVVQKTHELKQSVEYTKELLEKQDRFIKNAIHEINTPLSIILMNIDLYNLKYEKNRYLLKIEAAVKVLDNIYGDLEYIVKKDRVVYEKKMVDFSTFLLQRVAYFEDVAEGNKLEMKTHVAPDVFIVFNEIELQRICDNNISNAIKYSYENHALHVRLYEEKQAIVFAVENSGETIRSPEKLFNRYYREDVARGGFGLGLNIVKEICDANGVDIDVVSHEEKTCFSYRFKKERDEDFTA
ncbi:MAG: HAMP domain-containing histidine kinase [Epsilonproteobacteria bacterium]|nr:HAMP domain-containing histidine kinase [Campylobacterota bacterium]